MAKKFFCVFKNTNNQITRSQMKKYIYETVNKLVILNEKNTNVNKIIKLKKERELSINFILK